MDAAEGDDNPYIEQPDTEFDPPDTLGEEQARAQAEKLRDAIRYHDYRYYVEVDPIIPDRDYDALFERLETLEAEFDLETDGSPTQRVGGEPIDELTTVEHAAPMRSLDQSGDVEDVRDFDRRVRRELKADDYPIPDENFYVCEPKFDGLSLEVVYEDGRFERAATRGDGSEGDDVTEQVRTIPSVPHQLRGEYPEFLAVRGELYMPRYAFQEYNRTRVEEGNEPFANPRNAAAGTIRQLDPRVVARRPLAVYFFSILDASVEFDTHEEVYKRLPSWGLRVTDRATAVDDIEAAIAYRDTMLEQRDDLNYEVDGVVITVNDFEACDALGYTSRAPRYAFAYKFPARSGITTLRDIVIQVGRTGRLTPVALLDPVDVGGVTVSRANLHNPEEIQRLGVDVGDTVEIERAGDVIPDVIDVIEETSSGAFEFPDRCPACEATVVRDGPLAFCPAGLGCPAQREQAIEYYASRDALDIEGLGGERVTQLTEAALLEELADLYELSVADLATLEGWGTRSAEKLIEEIEATREPPLADFLTALGIPEVGPTTARALAREFGTFESVRTADIETLQTVPDIGPRVASAIREFFDHEENRAVIDRLLEHVEIQPEQSETGEALADLTFVFTGSLETFTRSEAQELIERHGANATSSVSGNTDYLVVGVDPGQRKRDDAAKYDVTEVSESDFIDLLQSHDIAITDSEIESSDRQDSSAEQKATLDDYIDSSGS